MRHNNYAFFVLFLNLLLINLKIDSRSYPIHTLDFLQGLLSRLVKRVNGSIVFICLLQMRIVAHRFNKGPVVVELRLHLLLNYTLSGFSALLSLLRVESRLLKSLILMLFLDLINPWRQFSLKYLFHLSIFVHWSNETMKVVNGIVRERILYPLILHKFILLSIL